MDEGHGFANPVNNLALTTAMERFFEQHLGGRSQKEVPQEVANKLDQLTVDPKSVVLGKKLEAGASNQAQAYRPLPLGKFAYDVKVVFGGQSMNMSLTTEIADGGASYHVTETMSTPQGDMKDVATLEKPSLALRSRKINQGPFAVELNASDAKVTGSITMGGSPKPVDVATGGPLFAQAAGGFSLGALPLADGYAAAYRTFEPQDLKVRVMQVTVLGSETVTVPAGTFDAFKIESKPADGSPGGATNWIDKVTRKPVKAVAILPRMNGATMTMELKP
jgi:hypothetical protein